MTTEMRAIAEALSNLSDAECSTLIAAVNAAPNTAPGFLAWLEHAADWELRRRNGEHFPLQPPEAAIDPSEEAMSIAGAMMLRALFTRDSLTMAAFFNAVVGEMTGGKIRH